MPEVLDHYLGKNGYGSQQYDGKADPSRKFNLWEPVDAEKDYGAHGSFDSRASYSAPELWTSMHRTLVWGVALALLGLGVAAWPRLTNRD
jgi:hypothetical protein